MSKQAFKLLPEDWDVMPSQKYCIRVTDGTHDTPKATEEGMYLLTSKNIKCGKINYESAYKISHNNYHEINKRSKVDRWDVLFSMIGTVGEIALIRKEPDFAIKNIGLFKCGEKIKGSWLYYYLRSSTGRKVLETYLTGTSQQFVSLGDLRKIPIISPKPSTQTKIINILSAYDDLIENNERRISILENMAEELYREWFVRMRFPGHENYKYHKGMPEGFELVPFRELVIINPNLKSEKDKLKPYVNMDDLSLYSMIFSYKEHRLGSSGAKFQNGDVLFPRITPCLENGKRGYVMNLGKDEIAIGSTEFIVFREKELPSEYIYFLTCQEEFRKNAELSMVGASGRQRVKEDCFNYFLIKKPPRDILDKYVSFVRPIFIKIQKTFNTIIYLRTTRDRLLTRLINGKLDVEKLDIRFPKSMEEELA